MAALRYQNNPHPNGRVPSYYAGNKQYPGSYAPIESQTRTSRRIHEGFSLTANYGLDTTSDDLNSSPYSSPYYVNGRYNSDNLTTQRGNSASVQGIERLLDVHSGINDFTDDDIETYLELWQGKQIKFEMPYNGRVVGNTITLKNTEGSTGILSIYISTSENAEPIYEASIDLCDVSQDKFEHREIYSITTIPAIANPRKKLYVRMEIWDEIKIPPCERSENPFNTGKKIQIAATGKRNHWACEYKLQDKSEMVTEKYDYKRLPNAPLIGLIYNNYEAVPTDRLDNIKTGATVSKSGYRYDIFCAKTDDNAEVIIYDTVMNKVIPNTIKVDARVKQLNIAQVTDTNKQTWVYYVDGYSPLQRFKIGEWVSSAFDVGSADKVTANIDANTWYNSPLGNTSGTYIFEYEGGSWKYNGQAVSLSTYGISLSGGSASEGATITVIYTVATGGAKNIESIQYVDARPVIAASMIMFHNNRLYLTGFRNDPNLVQVSAIDAEGPNFTQFPYRFYAPNRSPYDTSLNPITAITEYASDQIMISFKNGFSIYSTYGSRSSTGLEDGTPSQVSTFTDSSGVQAQGDIVNYKGTIYSFNEKEGIRQFNGALWRRIPNNIDSYFDRVDMTKPRKMWGFSDKLYFNYTDKLDGKAKCIIWDMQINYQQFPWFQDIDIPFCDVRFDETEDLIGIHPDYPCIMKHYVEDTWRRFDSPIVFRRDSKFLSLPGNAADIIVKRVHTKVIANSNRIWYISINDDKQFLTQYRGIDSWFRQPSWDTVVVNEPVERPFAFEDPYEQDAIYRMTISNLRIQCSSVQIRTMTKTFRSQANLISTLVEVQPRMYN